MNSEAESKNALIQTFFYPNGACLNGDAFRQIWQRFGYLGQPPAEGYLCDREELASDKAIFLRFGSLEDLQRAMPVRDGPILGSCCHQSGEIDQFGFLSETCSVSNYAMSAWEKNEAPGRSSFEISQAMLNRCDPWFDHTLDLIVEHTRLADACGALYGLVDFSEITDNLFGGVYDSVVHLNKPLHRLVENSRWRQHAWRCSQVRSIYWGNYLGASICERLAPDFVARYRELVTGAEEQLQAYIWELGNGLFFSLSLNPLMDRDENRSLSFPVETRVNWLVNEFCKAGVL